MTIIGTIKPHPPYNFALLLNILSRFAYPTLDIQHDNAYWRVLRSQESLALLKITRTSPTKQALNVEIVAQNGDISSQELLKKVSTILGAHRDLQNLYQYMQSQPEVWSVIQPIAGLPLWQSETMFEALMEIIIEQQIAWTAAQKAQQWLLGWANHCLEYKGRTHYAFPTPQQIANANIDDLKPLKITFRRMEVMRSVAQQIMEKQLDLEAMRALPVPEIYSQLMAIKGIGHWTATWTIIRALGIPDYVGYNDVVLQAATQRYFYDKPGKASLQAVQDTFAKYGEFAGWIAYLTMMRWVYDEYAINSPSQQK